MSEMLRELEEDMKRERLQKLWNRFGAGLVALSVVVVLATIAGVIWQDHTRDSEMAQTSRFITGTDRMKVEDYKGAVTAFDELTTNPKSAYYGLSMLRKAQALQLSGDMPAANKTYQQLAGASDGAFSALASLLVTTDGAAPQAEPAAGTPFYYSAMESRAWRLLEQGKKDEALTHFAQLRDAADAPSSLRERAREVMQHVAPKKMSAASPQENIHE